MLIGYARTSKADQNIDLQTDELKKAGCEKIFIDRISGTKEQRPELNECIKYLRTGDKLVIWRFDRLGRSLKHLITIFNELNGKGIEVQSLKEEIDTSSATGKLTFHIFASLAEFERELIVERTKAGLESARSRGKLGGRPKKLSENDVKKIKKLLEDKDITIKEIAETFNVSRKTIYRYIEKAR